MGRHTSRVYKHDIGAFIVVPLTRRNGQPVDVSAALLIQIKMSHPATNTEKIFQATFASPPFGNGTGEDGSIQYITINESDLPESGKWYIQPYVEFTPVEKFHGQPTIVHVGEIPTAVS